MKKTNILVFINAIFLLTAFNCHSSDFNPDETRRKIEIMGEMQVVADEWCNDFAYSNKEEWEGKVDAGLGKILKKFSGIGFGAMGTGHYSKVKESILEKIEKSDLSERLNKGVDCKKEFLEILKKEFYPNESACNEIGRQIADISSRRNRIKWKIEKASDPFFQSDAESSGTQNVEMLKIVFEQYGEELNSLRSEKSQLCD